MVITCFGLEDVRLTHVVDTMAFWTRAPSVVAALAARQTHVWEE